MRRSRSFPWVRLVLAAVVCTVIICGWLWTRARPSPEVSIQASHEGVGQKTAFAISLSEPSKGLADVVVDLRQADKSVTLFHRAYRDRYVWAPATSETVFEDKLLVKTTTLALASLSEGQVTLRVVALGAGAFFGRERQTSVSRKYRLYKKSPSISVLSRETHVKQGGSEAVVYRVESHITKHGVQAGDWWFPGFPLPGGESGEQFALFAAPYDLGNVRSIRLVSEDPAGNRSERSFVDGFQPKPFRRRTLPVSDRLLEKVVPEITAKLPNHEDKGSLLANYVYINRTLRAENRARLRKIARKSQKQFLWKKAFRQMPSQVLSSFADRRTYVYQGEKIDQQDHLGYDLASTAKSDIPASNDGQVVVAEYFGIYGQAVVIDHGYGLMTLYAHLSSIDTRSGAHVKRGQVIGRTGSSGLALGDHLHFTTLLHGLPVDAKEWWDAHWIRDRIARKLGSASGLEVE